MIRYELRVLRRQAALLFPRDEAGDRLDLHEGFRSRTPGPRVVGWRYGFSEKARIEMEVDGLTEIDVAESIINAVAIYKRLRSRSRQRSKHTEYLYVIQATNLESIMVYSKGKLVQEHGEDHFYFLVSAKRAL